jgi:hypothetical protein
MTDVFRSEILAVVMQQIVDEPVLPVLFLRTVRFLSFFPFQMINDDLDYCGIAARSSKR